MGRFIGTALAYQQIVHSMYAYHFNGNVQKLLNQQVHFHIRDVYVPEPAQILAELHKKDLLRGTVVDLSDKGSEKGAFVVVEVEGLSNPVVVPAAKIVGIGQ